MNANTVQIQADSLLQKAFHAGEELAKLGLDTLQIKEKVGEAVENGMKSAKRTVKHGRHAAEDVLDDAAYCIKHEPLRSVAVSFGVGVGVGAMVGWLATRNGRH